MSEREEEQDIEEVYDDDAREDLVENDEISPEEEAFMAGYEDQKERKQREGIGDEAYEKAFDSGNEKKKKK